jgi:hypothetical protein
VRNDLILGSCQIQQAQKPHFRSSNPNLGVFVHGKLEELLDEYLKATGLEKEPQYVPGRLGQNGQVIAPPARAHRRQSRRIEAPAVCSEKLRLIYNKKFKNPCIL